MRAFLIGLAVGLAAVCIYMLVNAGLLDGTMGH
jgi:hypothetical protein